jgi:hypothetical protein
LKSCNIYEHIFVYVAAAGRECDIPFCSPGDAAPLQDFLTKFFPLRRTTYTRTVGFRVSESTHFRPRRDRSSVCSAVTGNGMLSKAASPFRQQRSQKV